ncbi:(E)-4-hydroxy-3-methylbut-2-enyl-diphosphate synthase [Bacteroidota bacterium]
MIVNIVSKKYCNDLTSYSRFISREVNIGDIPLGGDNQIRIQSMTTTDTMDTKATVEQCIRIFDAGADYVRITAPSIKEAENLANIKEGLKEIGYSKPLIADIHFTPNAAEIAARIVEKVRINPGNYADKKRFASEIFSEEEYTSEVNRIREKFTPLAKICKEYGTALRIGTNHGSLSDRIMSRYGDTPLGMVESALEFVRICEELNFYDIVLSMKASNPKVMVQAYRLLMNKMIDEGMSYPIHLGVTEAGEGEDGRIKSSIGIGTLLEDGIGDTIRVSLTEEPEAEIPVALELVERYSNRTQHKTIPAIIDYPVDPFEYTKRITNKIGNIGNNNVPVVVLSYNAKNVNDWNESDIVPEYLYLSNNSDNHSLPQNVEKIYDYDQWLSLNMLTHSLSLLTVEQYLKGLVKSDEIKFVSLFIEDLETELIDKLSNDENCIIVLNTDNTHAMVELRRAFVNLIKKNLTVPVIIKRDYKNLDEEKLMLHSSTDVGGLLIDGLGDGVWITSDIVPLEDINKISFGILQASGTRISKAEFISCPSCGRTLFDLQETTAKIKSRTNHLKGVKIAIMGCIVNGPGEMADAHYGYVGSGPGKISLYRGKDVVKKNIDTEIAVDELVDLIKENGDWIEP